MKKFLCAVLAAVCLFSFCSCSAQEIYSGLDSIFAGAGYINWAEFSDEKSETGSKYKNHFDALTSDQKKGYNNILESIMTAEKSLPEKTEVPYMTAEDLTKVFEAVVYDNPEIICIGRDCKIITEGSRCYFKAEYSMSLSEFHQKLSEMDKKCDEIIGKIPADASDFEKELYIHDYIVKNCDYDDSRDVTASMTYSCIVAGSAACEGYAKAAKYLLEKAEIECFTLVGDAQNFEGENESHMWNIVNIDGEYYHLDTTWDDPDGSESGMSHIYMNLNDDEIKKDHSNFYTDIKCTAVKANYFAKESCLFSSFKNSDYNKLKSLLAKRAKNGEKSIEIRFENETAYKKAIKSLIENGMAYSLASSVNKNYGTKLNEKNIAYTADDNFFVLELIF